MKKFTAVSLMIILILGTCIYFADNIMLKLTNAVISRISPAYEGQVSSLDINFSEGLFNLGGITASLKGSGEKFLEVNEAKADVDWTQVFREGKPRLAFKSSGIHLNITENLVESLTSSSSSSPKKQDEEKTSLPVHLTLVDVENINITTDQPQLDLHIDDVYLNYKNGSGRINNITGKFQNDLQFLQVSKIEIGLPEDILANQGRYAVTIIDPKLRMSENLLQSLNQLPFPESTPSGPDSTPDIPLKYFKISSFEAVLLSEPKLKTTFESFVLNVPGGTAILSDLSGRAGETPFMDVPLIKAGFPANKLFSSTGTPISLKVENPNFKIGPGLMNAMRVIPPLPQAQTEVQTEEKSSNQSQASNFKLSDVYVSDFNAVISGNADLKAHVSLVDIKMSEGNGEIRNISGTLLPKDLHFVDIEKIAMDFAPYDPLKNLAVSIYDPNFKVSQDLIQAFTEVPKIPETIQAQEEKPQETGFNAPVDLKALNIYDFDFLVSSDSPIKASVGRIKLDLQESKGHIKNIVGTFLPTDLQFLDVEKILLNFGSNPLSAETPKLGIVIEDPNIKISEAFINALKNLPSLPQAQEEKEAAKSSKMELPIQMTQFKVTGFDFTKLGEPALSSHVSLLDVDFSGGTALPSSVSNVLVKDSSVSVIKPPVKGEVPKIVVKLDEGKVLAEDITATLKTTNDKFFHLKKMGINFDPSELLGEGEPHLEVILTQMHMVVTEQLMKALKMPDKKEKEKKTDTLPFHISRVLVGSSKVSFPNYPGVGGQKHLSIEDIFGNIYNISMEPGTPLGTFLFNGTFEGDSKMIAKGRFDLAEDPIKWSANGKLLGFDLTKMNEELRERIPITYTEGTLSAFGEAITRDGKVIGYVKPFYKDVGYFGNEGEFKGIKHFFVEAFGTFANWLLENDRRNSVATRIPFEFSKGELNTDVTEATLQAVQHGLFETDPLKRGIGDKYRLKEAQEEKPNK